MVVETTEEKEAGKGIGVCGVGAGDKRCSFREQSGKRK